MPGCMPGGGMPGCGIPCGGIPGCGGPGGGIPGCGIPGCGIPGCMKYMKACSLYIFCTVSRSTEELNRLLNGLIPAM